ncbi:MAG: hypothetical protein HZC41_22080 [Chloroflexi bacterium]|nr:hypothetical protein [Chloroflexota bacterium]
MATQEHAGRLQTGSGFGRKRYSQRLDGRDVRRLTNVEQVVRVVAGSAWITLDGEDILVNRGETVTLQPGVYPPVISSMNGRPLEYEVWR